MTLVKQLSKPLANQIKAAAITNPGFRSFCVWLGRAESRVDAAMDRSMRSGEGESEDEAKAGVGGSVLMESGRQRMNYATYLWLGSSGRRAPLDEEEAVRRAADWLGEAVVYSVAVAGTAAEYYRSNVEKAEKARAVDEAKRRDEKRVERLEEDVRALHARVEEALAGSSSSSSSRRTRNTRSAAAGDGRGDGGGGGGGWGWISSGARLLGAS